MSNKIVVTGHSDAGASKVISQADMPGAGSAFKHTPGFVAEALWQTESNSKVGPGQMTFTVPVSMVPGPGGTVAMLVTFPPESSMDMSKFDLVAARKEVNERLPGIAGEFEADNPGFHATNSIDYGIVTKGEIWLALDEGDLTHLRPGDMVVQGGTRHAWRNLGTEPATIIFVLVGAQRVK